MHKYVGMRKQQVVFKEDMVQFETLQIISPTFRTQIHQMNAYRLFANARGLRKTTVMYTRTVRAIFLKLVEINVCKQILQYSS